MPMLQGKLIQAAQSSALALSTAPWTADLAQAAQGVVDRRKTEKKKKKKKGMFCYSVHELEEAGNIKQERTKKKSCTSAVAVLFCCHWVFILQSSQSKIY